MSTERSNQKIPDLLDALAAGWRSIDGKYKTAFFICLVVNVFVYLIFITQQPMHNHGILERLLRMNPMEQWPAGRWFSPVVLGMFNFDSLMVVLPVVVICLHVVGGMLVVRLWTGSLSTFYLTAGGLFMSLYPAVMTSFNFFFVGPLFSLPHLIAPAIFLVVSRFSVGRILLGSILTCLMMASYQPGLSFVATLFTTYAAVLCLETKGSLSHASRTLVSKLLPIAIAIVVGVVAYRISLVVLNIKITETTKTIEFSNFLQRLLFVSKAGVKSLFMTQPEFLAPVKYLLFGVLVAGAGSASIHVLRSNLEARWIRVVSFATAVLASILATKAMYLVSSNNQLFIYRYNHALGYLYLFGFWLWFRYTEHNQISRNFAYVIFAFCLVKFAYADIGRQQVLLRAETHYLATANRILYRIESLPGIDLDKSYKIVRLGGFSKFKLDQLSRRGHESDYIGSTHFDAELSPVWGPGDIFLFLGTRLKLQGYMNPNFVQDMNLATQLARGRGKWPAADSIFIHEDMIIVNM
ncbi:glucosyltransferase domain-containing protein [Haliea sp. E17]|uniref:glucosyltransferase domain-containing protein n=1 Tax=Haliea sp. E17 TaxID=3401576 RepID=UPI003AAEAF71